MNITKTLIFPFKRKLAFVIATSVVAIPWVLFFIYIYSKPLNPTYSCFNLYWTINGDTFDKKRDIISVRRLLNNSRRETIKLILPNEIEFKKIRLDPMVGKFGVVTIYELRVYDEKGNLSLQEIFKHDTPGWHAADCNQGDSADGLECYTYGNLALASPVYNNIKAKRVEVQAKITPLNAVPGFLSWLFN